MRDKLSHFSRPALAFIAGGALILSFAPYGYSIVQIISVAFLFHLILSASSKKSAFFYAWSYGTAWMIAGVHWLFFSMHDFGGLSPVLAASGVVLLGLFMGLLPAFSMLGASFIRQKLVVSDFLMATLILPSALTLAEWTRGWLLTGFPWTVLGYAHTDNALAGFAPICGVYGVTLFSTLLAGNALTLASRKNPRRTLAFIIGLIIILGGYGLKFIHWTKPVNQPIKVRLLQGNIPQEMKFSRDNIEKTLERYHAMITAESADLIVTPETAVPIYLHQVPKTWYEKLEQYSVQTKTTLAIGIPIAENIYSFTNSLLVVSSESEKPHHFSYRYDKHHLVPFGEFIPTGFRWFMNLMHMPLGDFKRGTNDQAPFPVKGQWILPNICYEDIFGEEIAYQIRSAHKQDLPEPTLMLNLSNIAWFGNSLALPQHLQISRMRAIEMQRPMLRSTNTGVTAIIDAKGNIQGELPYYTLGTLEVTIQGYQGMTPYIILGNALAIVVTIILLLAGSILAHYRLTKLPGYTPNPLTGRNDWNEL